MNLSIFAALSGCLRRKRTEFARGGIKEERAKSIFSGLSSHLEAVLLLEARGIVHPGRRQRIEQSVKEPQLVATNSMTIAFTPREASGALRRPRTGGRQTLIHHKSVSSKLPNHHIYAVSAFHQPALVRERHPVGLARLGVLL